MLWFFKPQCTKENTSFFPSPSASPIKHSSLLTPNQSCHFTPLPGKTVAIGHSHIDIGGFPTSKGDNVGLFISRDIGNFAFLIIDAEKVMPFLVGTKGRPVRLGNEDFASRRGRGCSGKGNEIGFAIAVDISETTLLRTIAEALMPLDTGSGKSTSCGKTHVHCAFVIKRNQVCFFVTIDIRKLALLFVDTEEIMPLAYDTVHLPISIIEHHIDFTTRDSHRRKSDKIGLAIPIHIRHFADIIILAEVICDDESLSLVSKRS